jgi:hypothetical protein
MEGMGEPRPEESQLAMNFLMRLDSSRYADMMTSLTNAAARDIPFPNTFQSAYNVASSWKNYEGKDGNWTIHALSIYVF